MIITISGTPGTGKSSVGKLLAKDLKWGFIELNVFARNRKLFCGYDRKRKTNIVDVDGLKKEIKSLKGNLVLASHYAHEMEGDFTVVLHCDIKELRERLERRCWSEGKIEENVQAEIFEICKEEAVDLGMDVIEVDTTGKTPEQAASELKKKLSI